MDVLTMTITHAILYAGISQNYTETPTVNWTELSPTRWWGPAEEEGCQDTAIYSANITFEDEMITDLKERLSHHMKFVPGLEGIAFQYGFNSNVTYRWIDRWLNQYDFKARETFFNQYPIYKTNIQGLDIFYIRVTPEVPEGKERIPLLLLHGFPSSFREFYDIIPKLTAVSDDRDFVVDLIVPCLPGFGYSEGAVRAGLGSAHIAVVLRNLMHRIGYKKFYTHGGDFGSSILGQMVTIFPEEVLGYHTNYGLLTTPVAVFLQMVGQLYPPLVLSNLTLYSRMYPLQDLFYGLMAGTGYFHLQSTKPDTLGIALTDSPTGLLAWVLEIYGTIANKRGNVYLEDGGLDTDYDMNFLLDTLTLYWSSKSIQTAMRLYAESCNINHFGMRLEQIPTSVPMWLIQAAEELTYQSPVILGLKFKNILHVDTWDEGAHFLSVTYPDRFSQSIMDGLDGFRMWHLQNGTDTTTMI